MRLATEMDSPGAGKDFSVFAVQCRLDSHWQVSHTICQFGDEVTNLMWARPVPSALGHMSDPVEEKVEFPEEVVADVEPIRHCGPHS